MKQVFALLLLLTITPMLFCADVTTLDGTVYKNAQVVNTMPDGILISFVDNNNFDTVKLVKFKDLPENIQKEYGYNPKKAQLFEKEHQQWLDEQQKKAIEEKIKAKQPKLEEKNSNRILSELNKGEADTVADEVEKSTTAQDKAKLNRLMKKLDDIGNSNSSAATEADATSISGLLHTAVSSTEEEVKEVNELTSDPTK